MGYLRRDKNIKNSRFLAGNTYNIRGWLTSINDPENLGGDLFAMRLLYNETEAGLTKNAQYNGNINAMVWNAANYNQVQGYGFNYDGINRITEADYQEKPSAWNDLAKYTVDNISYDYNGNIETLNRQGQSDQIDALDYDYSGNQLIKVTDNATGTKANGFKDGANLATEYLYDNNGNMVRDFNKSIDTIVYNYMNLPELIYFGNIADENYLEYIYDAAGTKLIKYKVENGIVTDSVYYIGNFVYNNDSLGFMLTEEGRCTPTGNGNYLYEYFIKDHLGNNRVSFADLDGDGTAELTQEDHYYPFGMTMDGLSYVNGVNKNKYLYNGKELQDDAIGGTQLDWYDYGARMYDPSLGRWHTIDPLSEKYYKWSPYNYAVSNPICFLDPNGMEIQGFPKDGYGGTITTGSVEYYYYGESTNPEGGENNKSNEKKDKETVAIDPGHGDHHNKNKQVDPGAVNDKDYEKDYVLTISNAITSKLKEKGYTIIQTRTDDVKDVGEKLKWRIDKATGSSIFISIHLNASDKATANGFQVCYKSGDDKSKALATSINKQNTLFKDRGISARDNLYVLNKFSGVAVLVEAGFISNSSDLNIIKTKSTEIGNSIATGIINYLEK